MSARAWTAFVAVSVLWGVPYFFIKLAVGEVSPAFLAWARIGLGALILIPVAWRMGAFRGLRARAAAVVAYAASEIVVPFVLIPIGEQRIASSAAAILIAAMPLIVTLMSVWLLPMERASITRLIGLVTGLAGVAALVGIDFGGRKADLVGAGCVLLATVCYATATIIVKRFLAELHPLGTVAVALGVASLALTPLAALSAPTAMPSALALLSLGVLGVACTAAALVAYFRLIAEAGPSRAAVITYVNPAVAVVLGVAVLRERIGPVSVVGLLLILAGSWLSTGGLSRYETAVEC